jgi:methionyl-tRNA formyltransferase
LLPKYRGGSAINWQLINGETVGGVTLFRPDDGIDEGPIYLQKEIPIGSDETAGSFYYSAVFEPGVAATIESVEMLLAGTARGVPQDDAKASYEPLCRDEHAGVDWTKPARVVHNLVRGCDPSPGAHCRFGEKRVRLYGSRVAAAATTGTAPGTVIAIDDKGIEIAAADGSVRFAKLSVGGPKVAAAQAAGEIGLRPGDRLTAI